MTQRASRQYLVWDADQGPLHDSMSLWYSVYNGSVRKPHKELYRDPLRRIHIMGREGWEASLTGSGQTPVWGAISLSISEAPRAEHSRPGGAVSPPCFGVCSSPRQKMTATALERWPRPSVPRPSTEPLQLLSALTSCWQYLHYLVPTPMRLSPCLDTGRKGGKDVIQYC